ncbi:hypothetical protein Tco_0919197 [Tanacetum coccineum]
MIKRHMSMMKLKEDDEIELKKHMELFKNNKVAIDAIPLATKPLIIVEYKIVKEGIMGYFQLIRADGSSKRPEDDHERVLLGDLKLMFEPDIKSEVWRSPQGYKVTTWKLFDSCGLMYVKITTALRVSTVRRIMTREEIKIDWRTRILTKINLFIEINNIEEANITWDNVQAMIDADYQMAQ